MPQACAPTWRSATLAELYSSPAGAGSRMYSLSESVVSSSNAGPKPTLPSPRPPRPASCGIASCTGPMFPGRGIEEHVSKCVFTHQILAARRYGQALWMLAARFQTGIVNSSISIAMA